MNELRDAVEFRLVEVSSSLAFPRRSRRARQRIIECFQLAHEILRSLRLHAIFQALIKDERVPQIEDRVLIGRALHRLELLGLLPLLIDLFQKGRELGETEIFPIALLPAKEAEHFGVLDNKDRILVGHRSVKEDIGKPLHSANLFPVGEPHSLFAANNEQRIARNRIERLDPAADEHRDSPEAGQIEIAACGPGRQPAGGEPEQSKEKDKSRNETFHASAVLLRLENPTRWYPNCTSNPAATTMHAMYGAMKLGLRTTCKIVVRSSFSKPAW